MKIVGVSFKDKGKIYNFDGNDFNVETGTNVIVETEKGEQIGVVCNIVEGLSKETLKRIVRIATDQDYNKYLKNLKDAKEALIKAREIAKSLNLPMQIIDANYTFDRKQLLFNFVADERIDFRELVKQLASLFKTRIELHQMGARDKAKDIGGIGPCGHELCCTSFIKHIDAISINMAKNQNIALNPSKINGLCGRLLCCLSYEDDSYTECRKDLPQVGTVVKKGTETGTVIFVDILNRKYKVDFNGTIKEYSEDGKE